MLTEIPCVGTVLSFECDTEKYVIIRDEPDKYGSIFILEESIYKGGKPYRLAPFEYPVRDLLNDSRWNLVEDPFDKWVRETREDAGL